MQEGRDARDPTRDFAQAAFPDQCRYKMIGFVLSTVVVVWVECQPTIQPAIE